MPKHVQRGLRNGRNPPQSLPQLRPAMLHEWHQRQQRRALNIERHLRVDFPQAYRAELDPNTGPIDGFEILIVFRKVFPAHHDHRGSHGEIGRDEGRHSVAEQLALHSALILALELEHIGALLLSGAEHAPIVERGELGDDLLDHRLDLGVLGRQRLGQQMVKGSRIIYGE